jgi:hypothetical protein
MPKPRKDPYKPRPCRFCKLEFKPTTKNPKNADEQEFCCAAHRKEFWKHGKLPFQKLQLRMEKRMRQIAREEIEIAASELLKRYMEQINITSTGLCVRTEPQPEPFPTHAKRHGYTDPMQP